jgi:small subunit ribosomal protein S7
MSRRRRATRRPVVPDSRYNSALVSSLINSIMLSGKKSTSQGIVYGSFEIVAEKLGKGDPIDVLLGALENVRPKLEVKSRRVGGATYQVPLEISFERQQSLAFRWIREAARARKGEMKQALAAEIIDAYNNTGSVVKKKEDTHKMAQSNRAFAHLRW